MKISPQFAQHILNNSELIRENLGIEVGFLLKGSSNISSSDNFLILCSNRVEYFIIEYFYERHSWDKEEITETIVDFLIDVGMLLKQFKPRNSNESPI